MNTLRPNETRAKTAIILIWIVLGLEIISLISGYLQSNILYNAESGVFVSMEEAEANDIRETLIGLLYSLTFIVSAVTFIRWFRRAYYNMHQKVTYLSYGEGWAAGGWFVPILNWFRPLQIMNELYQYTPEFLAKSNIVVSQKLTKGILGVWWTLWVGNNILANASFQFSRRAEDIGDYILMNNLSMISNVVGIPLALITIKVIKDYAKMEPLLFQTEEEILTNSFDIGSSTTLLDD